MIAHPATTARPQVAEVIMPAWKRAMDISGSLLGLVVLFPVMVLVALAIVIDSRGAPVYRQKRVGQGGRVFTIWKFRSMHVGADRLLSELMDQNEASGHIFKMKEDPRITRVGRFIRKSSLDELPQLWNVLNGSMSIVGPRPPTVSEVNKYDTHQLARLATVPGITGLWQVTKRGDHNFEDMVLLDVEYADRLSFMLDLSILLRTVPTVLGGKGSY
ncbi:hypothetical protein AYO38_05360 [bacterium SCGC AG-212-C10]|nr:hypothetical protein AYO38_05360 [bacterium SCGC AG-212-C10]